MTDLLDLLELLPDARQIGGSATSGQRPIAWVRVMRPRVPAFEALDPGDLAIVPAPALELVAPTGAELRVLVEAFAAAPVSGVVLVDADRDGDGGPLVERLRAAAIPGLRVPPTDVPALERSIIGFIVARGAELERQAGLLEAELQRRALEGGGAPALVAAIATFLGRAVALEGPAGDVIAVHAPATATDEATAATRYQAAPRRVAALRFPLPAAGAGPPGGRVSSAPAGNLVVLGGTPPGELGQAAIDRIGGLLALELARDEAVRQASDHARAADPLPAAGPPWVVLLARQRTVGADDDGAADRETRETARRAVRLLAPARRMALRGDADSLELRAVLAVEPAAADTDDPDRHPLAARIAGTLDRTVALSLPFRNRADRPGAEAEARSTLEAALGLADPPRVARASRLPAYRMLGALTNLPDGRRLATALLAPLLTGRADVTRERLATLRALLDRGGINEAAAALGVHRNTIAYRVRRIEAATGWRLSDPELRLPLSIAVRFVQDRQD